MNFGFWQLSCQSFSSINCYNKWGPFYICITLCTATRVLVLWTPWNKCSPSIPHPSLFSCDRFAHCSDRRSGDGSKSELWCVASECLRQLVLTWHCLDRISRLCCISRHKAFLLLLLHRSSWTDNSSCGVFPCTQACDNFFTSGIHRFWMWIRSRDKLVRKAHLVPFGLWLKSNFLYQ